MLLRADDQLEEQASDERFPQFGVTIPEGTLEICTANAETIRQLIRQHGFAVLNGIQQEKTDLNWHPVSNDDGFFSLWHDDHHYTQTQVIFFPKQTNFRKRKTGIAKRKETIQAIARHINMLPIDDLQQKDPNRKLFTTVRERIYDLAETENIYESPFIHQSRKALHLLRHEIVHHPRITPDFDQFVKAVNNDLEQSGASQVITWDFGKVVAISSDVLHYRVMPTDNDNDESYLLAAGLNS